jgi:two-component system sensor histidine kinase/response regulator
LSRWGMQPTVVDRGPKAIDAMLRAEQEGAPFQLILLDGHMPDMDGFTLAKRIRESTACQRAPIMMLSSADQREDTLRCRASGIGAYLLKPINPPELLEVLLQQIGNVPTEYLAQSSGPDSQLIPMQSERLEVLAVEDNVVNQRLILRLLEKRGHSVTLASDGFQALTVLVTKSFDVIFMDIQMPGLTGYDVTARIRADEHGSGARIPIIALTAYAMEGDRERCLAAGMDGYLTKPVRFQDLDQILASVTRRPAATEAPFDVELQEVLADAPTVVRG